MKKLTILLLMLYAITSILKAQPTTAPTAPTKDALYVVAIYSEAYVTNIATNTNPNWGQSTVVTEETIATNKVLKYAGLNYQGTDYATTNVSSFENFHLDYWTSNSTSINIYVIKAGGTEVAKTLTVATGSWQSIDIPLTDFAGVDLTGVNQLKVVGNGDIYFDNLYFWKNAPAAGTDATLSDLKVGGSTITGFSANTLNYTVSLPKGTTVVPTVTCATTDASATFDITAATAIPGTTTIVVTAGDNTTTKTYNVTFAIERVLPFDFETIPVTADFGSFNGAVATVEDNTLTTGINSSSKNGKMVKNGTWSGTSLTLSSNLDFSVKKAIKIKVLTTTAGQQIKLKLEGSVGPIEKDANSTKAGEWETVLFDFTGATNNVYNKLVFFLDGASGGTATLLFDDIEQYEITQSTDATLSALSVSSGTLTPAFNAATENYTVTLADGASVPTVTYTINDAPLATAVKTNATGVPGTTTIVVTAEAGNTKTYSIKFAYPLTLPFSFETKPATSDFINFDGGTATVIVNPQSSGINTSSKVAQMVRNGAAVWAGSKIILTNNLDFSTNTHISMKVYTTAPIGTKVTFKLEGGGALEKHAYTTVTGAWETLIYDFTATSATFNTLVFLFDLGNAGDGTASSTFLFDDITQYLPTYSSDKTLSDLKVNATSVAGFNASTLTYNVKLPVGTTAIPVVTATKNQAGATVLITQATSTSGTATVKVTAEDATFQTYTVNFSVLVPQVLPVTFEAAPYDISNFEGGALTVITNPHTTGNSSAKVGQLIKGAGSGAAGSYITLTSNIDFSVKPKISIKVYSPRVGATMLFKLEGSSGPTEKTKTSTVANAWETFTFDFTGAASNVYNKMVFIFDLGSIGDGSANYTFLIDDIEQTGTVASTDATLSDIKVSGTTITGFAAATLAYSVELPFGTTAIPAVTATKNNANATVVITPAAVLPGTTNIVVTAEDGTTTKTYTVAFTIKAGNTDATLGSLKVDGTAIVGFAPATLAYTIELPFGTTTVPTVTSTVNDATATAVITAATALPGTTSVVVTAQDGTTKKTYTVAFTLKAGNTDATLSSLKVDGIAITGFASTTLAYTMELPFGTTTIPVVTSTANDATATAVVTAASALPGTTSVEVTAQDGTTKKTYTINFTIAAPSSNASLSALLIDGLPLLDFASGTLAYNAELPLGTTVIPTITATLNDATATAVVTQAAALPGTATVVVTAQDGTTIKSYSIAFTVAITLSNDATLRDLKVNGITVSNFASTTLNYSVVLPYGTTAVPTVIGIRKNTAATVTVNAAASLSQTTTVVVTAQDGSTVLTYNVAFTIALPSNDAKLSNLLVSGISVANFDATKYNYSVVLPVAATVPPTVSAILNDATATYVITQATKLPDTATVVVRAQDGTTVNTYKIAFANAPLYKVAFTIVNHAQQALADAKVTFMLDTLTTDINGKVEFTQVSPTIDESYTVSKKGYADVNGKLSVVDADVSKTVTLEILTYSVKFEVVDSNNSPLADAVVAFRLDTLTTDINGRVEFTQVSPTIDEVYTVSKKGYVDATGTLSVIDADVSKTVTLEVQTYAVKFVVVDINTMPLADAEVAFMLNTLKTDANGIAEFTSVLPTTDALYSVIKSGYVDATGTVSVIDADIDLTVILEKVVYDVTFTVVDENDAAIADAVVEFNETTLTTDENGIAVFASVIPISDATYTITKANYIDATGTLSVIDANVDVKVQMVAVGIKINTALVGNIYPNPTKGALTIQLAPNVSEASLELFDINGSMVAKTTLNKLETTLDLSGNKSGIYLLKIVTENKQYIEKVVINK